ncbi:hypothetical protein ALC57_10050 [Trachymyrmex cornetzi]|uniref:Uncharacterized protein n=1 Tax=Trachymyrmex cornetzi TaxID=471704 RepID=A0A195DXX9_9HYME|nr:hypothetical protein ALC57_10050 [Trachymyrmex cornetzi]
MDGSLSRLPRTAASTLSLIPFLGFLFYLEDARRRRNSGPLTALRDARASEIKVARSPSSRTAKHASAGVLSNEPSLGRRTLPAAGPFSTEFVQVYKFWCYYWAKCSNVSLRENFTKCEKELRTEREPTPNTNSRKRNGKNRMSEEKETKEEENKTKSPTALQVSVKPFSPLSFSHFLTLSLSFSFSLPSRAPVFVYLVNAPPRPIEQPAAVVSPAVCRGVGAGRGVLLDLVRPKKQRRSIPTETHPAFPTTGSSGKRALASGRRSSEFSQVSRLARTSSPTKTIAEGSTPERRECVGLARADVNLKGPVPVPERENVGQSRKFGLELNLRENSTALRMQKDPFS